LLNRIELSVILKYFDFSVLRPLNITARVILLMKPRQENYTKPMFDIKVELDDISLNLTRDQVILLWISFSQ